MSITSQQIVSVTGDETDGIHREYSTTHYVTCSATTDGPKVALAGSEIYKFGDSYDLGDAEIDEQAKCIDRRVTEGVKIKNGGWRYTIVCKFNTRVSSPGINGESPLITHENPLDRPAVWQMESREVTQYMDKDVQRASDLSGPNDAKNSADGVLEGGLATQVYEIIWNVSWYSTPTVDLPTIENFLGSVNMLEWNTNLQSFPAFSCRCMDYRPVESVYENGVQAIKKSAKVHYKSDLHHPTRYVDAGFFEYDGLIVPTKTPIRVQNKLVTTAYPLDGLGLALSDDAPLVRLNFYPFREVNWAFFLT